MPLLRSLGLPSLTPKVLAFFASEGIISVEDFLLADMWRLEVPGNHEQKQGVTEILEYLERQSWGWRSGYDMLQQLETLGIQDLSTGCKSLDDLLGGGLREGTVTELVGASSTGKTQLCMQVAASVAYQCRAMVAYVDTCHSFSSTRIAHMLDGLVGSREGIQLAGAAGDFERVMRGILRFNIFNIFSMTSLLHELHADIGTRFQGPGEFEHLRLLIVDSASAVISPILGGNQTQGHSLMVSLGIILKKLALENHLAILITNHMVAGESRQPKPALGESWKSMPHVRLLLARDSSSNVCQVSVIKHNSMACNRHAAFRITNTGLQSVPENFNG